MKKSDTTYIVGSVFAAMTCFFYGCTMWFTWLSARLPRYYPLQHAWKWVNEKNVPSQGWYGMQAFAFICAGAVALIVYLILRRCSDKESTLKPAHTKLLGIAATVIMIVCMTNMLCHEFARWNIIK